MASTSADVEDTTTDKEQPEEVCTTTDKGQPQEVCNDGNVTEAIKVTRKRGRPKKKV